jgi:hypothetical protein
MKMSDSKKAAVIKLALLIMIALVVGLFCGYAVTVNFDRHSHTKESVPNPVIIDSVQSNDNQNSNVQEMLPTKLSMEDTKKYCSIYLMNNYSRPYETIQRQIYKRDVSVRLEILELEGVFISHENIWCKARFKLITRTQPLLNSSDGPTLRSEELSVWYHLDRPVLLEFNDSTKDEFESAVGMK